jgi:outer membrane autotransporter protein
MGRALKSISYLFIILFLNDNFFSNGKVYATGSGTSSPNQHKEPPAFPIYLNPNLIFNEIENSSFSGGSAQSRIMNCPVFPNQQDPNLMFDYESKSSISEKDSSSRERKVKAPAFPAHQNLNMIFNKHDNFSLSEKESSDLDYKLNRLAFPEASNINPEVKFKGTDSLISSIQDTKSLDSLLSKNNQVKVKKSGSIQFESFGFNKWKSSSEIQDDISSESGKSLSKGKQNSSYNILWLSELQKELQRKIKHLAQARKLDNFNGAALSTRERIKIFDELKATCDKFLIDKRYSSGTDEILQVRLEAYKLLWSFRDKSFLNILAVDNPELPYASQLKPTDTIIIKKDTVTEEAKTQGLASDVVALKVTKDTIRDGISLSNHREKIANKQATVANNIKVTLEAVPNGIDQKPVYLSAIKKGKILPVTSDATTNTIPVGLDLLVSVKDLSSLASTPVINITTIAPKSPNNQEMITTVSDKKSTKAKVIVNMQIISDVISKNPPLPICTKSANTPKKTIEINANPIFSNIQVGNILNSTRELATNKIIPVVSSNPHLNRVPTGQKLVDSIKSIPTPAISTAIKKEVIVDNVPEGKQLQKLTSQRETPKLGTRDKIEVISAILPEGILLESSTIEAETSAAVPKTTNVVALGCIPTGRLLPDSVPQVKLTQKDIAKLDVVLNISAEEGSLTQETVAAKYEVSPLLVSVGKKNITTSARNNLQDTEGAVEQTIPSIRFSNTKKTEVLKDLSQLENLDRDRPLVKNVFTYRMLRDHLDLISPTLAFRLDSLFQPQSFVGVASGENGVQNGLWFRIFKSYGKQKAKNNSRAFKNSQIGFVTGIDIELKENTLVVGAAYTNSHSETKFKQRLQNDDRQDMDLHTASIYGEYALTPRSFVNSYLTYGRAFINTTGNICGKATGNIFRARVGMLHRNNYKTIMLIPRVGVTFDNSRIGKIKVATNVNDNIHAINSQKIYANLGISLKKLIQLKSFNTVPEIHFNIHRILSSNKNAAVVNVIEGDIQSLVIRTTRQAKTTYNIGSSISFSRVKWLEFNIGYNYNFRTGFDNHSGFGSLVVKF